MGLRWLLPTCSFTATGDRWGRDTLVRIQGSVMGIMGFFCGSAVYFNPSLMFCCDFFLMSKSHVMPTIFTQVNLMFNIKLSLCEILKNPSQTVQESHTTEHRRQQDTDSLFRRQASSLNCDVMNKGQTRCSGFRFLDFKKHGT